MARDRLFRRFIVACLFAIAFVWVAVDFFDVAAGVVWEYLLLSIGVVIVTIVTALVVALLVVLARRWRGETRSGGRERP